ncbi:MAG TPA: hypothetical protein VND83_10440 [Acidimicrobiales bacterium]|nr:hypothetical protein [Acidimicrobiales bacterium]
MTRRLLLEIGLGDRRLKQSGDRAAVIAIADGCIQRVEFARGATQLLSASRQDVGDV